MITQATAVTPAEIKTCSQCSHFNDFKEANHRGWCNQFNHQARGHHQATNECIISHETVVSPQLEDNLALFPDVEELDAFPTAEIQDPADLPHSEYQVGSIVKVIDPEEHHSEWGVFEIVECRHNSHFYDTAETYLNQAEWYYLLSGLQYTNTSSSSFKSLWIAENDICAFDMAHNVSTNDIF